MPDCINSSPQSVPDPTKQKIVDYYRETEVDYDVWSQEGYLHFGYWRWGLNPLSRRRMLEEMNNVVFRELHLDSLTMGRVADLGCGVGATSRYGASRFPHLDWLGLTISPEQVAKGIRLIKDEPAKSRVRLTAGDYHFLPWADDSIDAIFFLESLCHSRAPCDALREAARVLRPGGRLVVVDGYMMFPPEKTPSYAKWIERQVANNWAVSGFHCIANLEDWANKAGFEQLRQEEAGWRVAPSAIHCPPLVAWHCLKLLLAGKVQQWRWQHLVASLMALVLGMQRKYFRYFLTTFYKPVESGKKN